VLIHLIATVETPFTRWQSNLISPTAGSLIAGMGNDPDVEELRRLERVCLEQAELCETPEGKAALLSMAADYRARRPSGRHGVTSIDRPGRTTGSGWRAIAEGGKVIQ
jgi:hypothetical protein